MSQEDDCSSNVEIEVAEVWLGNEESWGKWLVPEAKRGPATLSPVVSCTWVIHRRGLDDLLFGFVASEAVKWSEKDFVPSSTWQGQLFS